MMYYLHLKISQKESFDILYFMPSTTGILNLNDRGFYISSELLYTAITSLEIRLKAEIVSGERLECARKLNDCRVELRARHYF